MKTKLKSMTIILLLVFILISILIYPNEVIDSVLFGINIWIYNVFPSLFPFFILSDLLVYFGFIELLSELFKNTMKIFGLSGACSFPLLGSLVSGFPSGAKYTKQLLEEDLITIEEANNLIMFTHFSNPLFILGTIGSVLLQNYYLGLIILISHYTSNFIIGFIFRKRNNYLEKISIKKAINNMNNKRIKNKDTFSTTLSNSIAKNINTLFILLGIIIVFLILTTILDKIFSLPITIKGLIEMTQGIKLVANSNYSLLNKSLLITTFLSFGGISVHMQTSSIISNTKIKYKNFFIARIIHVAISVVLVYLLFILFI